MTYKPGDILKDRYLINEKLGNGSMGEVYRAEHLTLHRQVAIKVMHVHVAENEKSLARFRREAREVAKLDHPHICQVLDFDMTEEGDFYIVMEYLQGETLRERIDQHGKIKTRSAFRIMHDLLGALEMAHRLGIVHRDVKPDNIMLKNREGRDDYVKLIDFGIAHSDNPDDGNGSLTQTGQIYGTPQYLSPEQVMGEPVDERADLYSCGCILYEMLEGTPRLMQRITSSCSTSIYRLHHHTSAPKLNSPLSWMTSFKGCFKRIRWNAMLQPKRFAKYSTVLSIRAYPL